eukprot:CAMPEP_0194282022 /NCGR_PEP_ID=MMETSP0169-20130528/22165_1 /TAXON_ID=218684 /ORGANISM="Corethron pennatum, Strain L29A3" /LENGTH=414 /DNA_ID=CAMNT_0039027231 /DNA_START=363 /DNA_END=1610 /DNA_ORIENTATION=-
MLLKSQRRLVTQMKDMSFVSSGSSTASPECASPDTSLLGADCGYCHTDEENNCSEISTNNRSKISTNNHSKISTNNIRSNNTSDTISNSMSNNTETSAFPKNELISSPTDEFIDDEPPLTTVKKKDIENEIQVLMTQANIDHSNKQLTFALMNLISAMEKQKILYGHDCIQVAKNLVKVGIIYMELGSFDDSLAKFTESVAMKQKLSLIQADLSTAKTYRHIAKVHSLMGRNDKAKEALTECLRLHCAVLGEDNPMNATVCRSLGRLHIKTGDADAAARMFEESRRLNILGNGEDYGGNMELLEQLGKIYLDRGDYHGAIDSFCENIRLKTLEVDGGGRVGDARHDMADLATSWQNLGEAHERNNDLDEGLAGFRKSLEIYEDIGFSGEHPYVTNTTQEIRRMEIKKSEDCNEY